jgi:ribonuclease VapC
MLAARPCLVSAVSLMEASLVLAGPKGTGDNWLGLDELMARPYMQVVPHDASAAIVARDAFLGFGKGRHRAAPTICDCAAYALATSRGVPLLFKGGDFAATHVVPAL